MHEFGTLNTLVLGHEIAWLLIRHVLSLSYDDCARKTQMIENVHVLNVKWWQILFHIQNREEQNFNLD